MKTTRTRVAGRLGPLILLGLAVAAGGCSGKSADKGVKVTAPVPVVEGRVERKTMPDELHAIGNIEAYATVAVRSRVDGEITRVHFKEGDAVRAGQPLLTIDPRPFQAQVEQVSANLARDRALQDNARAQERRYQELLDKHFVSKEMYAQMRTNAASATAVVEADDAALKAARLQLAYSTLSSPIDGVTGNLKVQAGNLIKANDTGTGPLLTINRIRPIFVTFSIPERQLTRVRQLMAHGAALAVDATPSGNAQPAEHGKLTFVDNAVDTATGTIKLKATFDNADKALWPGQFADVRLILGQQTDALAVPSQAVQNGPDGPYVYVIRPDATVEQRKIVPERTVGAETVVRTGLAAGERIVLDGQLRLAPGAKVAAKPAP